MTNSQSPSQPSKKVPLVMYTTNQAGERVKDVIGTADVKADGTFTAKVDDRSEFAELLRGMSGSQFSIGFLFEKPEAVVSLVPATPCKGKNTNICVAEGCYNESCVREDKS